MPRKPWSDEELKMKLKELYPTTPNKILAKLLNISINQLHYKAKTLGVKKTDEFQSAKNRIDLSKKQIQFIRKNFETMSNPQIAKAIGVKLQYLRTKLYQMGLYRMHLEYWTEEQILFLRTNYQTKGDTELASIFNEKWPKNKIWTIKHIEKKRLYLNLKRTEEEVKAIMAPFWLPGGSLYQVHNLNASSLLTDRYVANTMSRVNRFGINEEVRDELMRHPEIIELKRQQLLLQRTIKQHGKEK